jgi:hypothetical protein
MIQRRGADHPQEAEPMVQTKSRAGWVLGGEGEPCEPSDAEVEFYKSLRIPIRIEYNLRAISSSSVTSRPAPPETRFTSASTSARTRAPSQ